MRSNPHWQRREKLALGDLVPWMVPHAVAALDGDRFLLSSLGAEVVLATVVAWWSKGNEVRMPSFFGRRTREP